MSKNHSKSAIALIVITLGSWPYKATAAEVNDIYAGGSARSSMTNDEAASYLRNHLSAIVPVHEFLDEDGTRVHCVPIHRQPALWRSESAGYGPVQMAPSESLRRRLKLPVRSDDKQSICPTATVEMRMPAMPADGRHYDARVNYTKGLVADQPSEIGPTGIGDQIRYYRTTSASVEATGAQSTINIWKPAVEKNDFSLTQIWVIGDKGTHRQTLEVGSQVFPNRLGDQEPHLFIYYTPDNYRSGCYDLTCPAFVKTSNILDIGGRLKHSTVGGAQAEGTVAFYRDPDTGNWILFFSDGVSYIQSGYYPAALFAGGQLSQFATLIEVGGEVASWTMPAFTATDMGSGRFATPASTEDRDAAYHRGIKYMGRDGLIRDLPLRAYTPGDNCYNLIRAIGPTWGTTIYFGGPGNSASCP